MEIIFNGVKNIEPLGISKLYSALTFSWAPPLFWGAEAGNREDCKVSDDSNHLLRGTEEGFYGPASLKGC